MHQTKKLFGQTWLSTFNYQHVHLLYYLWSGQAGEYHTRPAGSQDEQVTWAQYGHTQCVLNTRLLGHAPAMKNLKNCILRSKSLDTNTILSVLLICSLYIRMTPAIAHANNWLLTSVFYTIFTRAPANFTWHRLGYIGMLLRHCTSQLNGI